MFSSREKELTLIMGSHMILLDIINFSAEILQKTKCQTRIIYLTKLILKMEKVRFFQINTS
jgi:hypothetical protein